VDLFWGAMQQIGLWMSGVIITRMISILRVSDVTMLAVFHLVQVSVWEDCPSWSPRHVFVTFYHVCSTRGWGKGILWVCLHCPNTVHEYCISTMYEIHVNPCGIFVARHFQVCMSSFQPYRHRDSQVQDCCPLLAAGAPSCSHSAAAPAASASWRQQQVMQQWCSLLLETCMPNLIFAWWTVHHSLYSHCCCYIWSQSSL
jgi:hypothetical protein